MVSGPLELLTADDRKMKVIVQTCKIRLLYFDMLKRGLLSDLHNGPFDALQSKDRTDLMKDIKKLVSLCTDIELNRVFEFLIYKILGHESFEYDVAYLIFNHLQNKSLTFIRNKTALHYLVEYTCDNKTISKDHEDNLKSWIQSLPGGPERCPLDTDKKSPLHLACMQSYCHAVIVQILCQNMSKAQIETRDKYGKHALHYACANANSNAQMVQILCQNMTPDAICQQAKDGGTALDYACSNRNGNAEVVKVLCQNMALATDSIDMKDILERVLSMMPSMATLKLSKFFNNFCPKIKPWTR